MKRFNIYFFFTLNIVTDGKNQLGEINSYYSFFRVICSSREYWWWKKLWFQVRATVNRLLTDEKQEYSPFGLASTILYGTFKDKAWGRGITQPISTDLKGNGKPASISVARVREWWNSEYFHWWARAILQTWPTPDGREKKYIRECISNYDCYQVARTLATWPTAGDSRPII